MEFIELIKTILLSLILITLVHSIFNYFKDNFTEKKTYDYVNNPNEKYQNIYDKINSQGPIPQETIHKETINQEPPKMELNNTINDGTTNIDDLNNNDLNNNDGKKSNMKDELKMFLKGVQKNDVSGYEGSAGLTNNVL
jgi:hypothetical protein